MLILNSKSIENTAHPKGMIAAIQKALELYSSGSFLMPDRMHVNFNDNTLLLMPVFTNDAFGTKLVSVFPHNTKQNIPVIQGSFVLNDIETGKVLALMDGAALTAHRTGAVGGLAAKLLAKPDTKTLGIVGAGVQSFHQALYISKSIGIEKILIFDIFQEKTTNRIKKLQEKLPGIEIYASKTNTELTKTTDIIVTGTTSNKPVLPNNANLYKNKIILAFGSYKPGMKELPDAVFANAQIFTDTKFAKEESGDLAIPLKEGLITENRIDALADVISGKIYPDKEKTIIFKSVGMALFDITVGEYLYQAAKEKNIGVDVDF
jgi:ornithine cyclodeaminase